MSRRSAWIALFLGVTALAIAGELVAAFDTSTDTMPWTDLLGDYVPGPVTAVAVTVLVVWLPIHLYRRYQRQPEPTSRFATRSEVTTVDEEEPMTASGPRRLALPAGADARNRAWRTAAQGVLVDLLAAVALAVGPALAGADFAWTRAYWLTIGGLAAKTAIQTVVSYAARKVLPPPSG